MTARRDLHVIVKLNRLTSTRDIEWQEHTYCNHSEYITVCKDIPFKLTKKNKDLEISIIGEEDQAIWTADSFVIHALRDLFVCISHQQINITKILEDFLKED